MSKWCDTCYRNEITGEWEPCDESCPMFGRYFGAAKKLIDEINWIVQCYGNGWICAEEAVRLIYLMVVDP